MHRNLDETNEKERFYHLNNSWAHLPNNRAIGWVRKPSNVPRTPCFRSAIHETSAMAYQDVLQPIPEVSWDGGNGPIRIFVRWFVHQLQQ